MKKIVDFVT